MCRAADRTRSLRCRQYVRIVRTSCGGRNEFRNRPYVWSRVGGGALLRWPPSAAQTVHAGFPHTAFTKIQTVKMPTRELAQQGEQVHTRRRASAEVTTASQPCASA